MSQIDRVGKTTTFDYTTVAGSTIVTDPDGLKNLDAYTNGLRTQATVGYQSSAPLSTLFVHDPATLGITKVTDPNGHDWLAGYDTAGNRTSTQDPAGRTTSATFNAWNVPDTVTNAEGVTTTFGYDTAGNVASVATPLDLVSTRTVTFDHSDTTHPGDVTAMTDERGKTWLYGYDTYGARTSVTDPLGNAATATVNDLGWVTSSRSPRGNETGATPTDFETTYTFDDYGNVLTVNGPENTSVTRTYDANRNLATVTDADNHTTTYGYNTDDKLTTVTRPDATSLTNVYSNAGRLTQQIDTAGQATAFVYDAYGRLGAQTDQTGAVTELFYDPAGNLTARQDPGGDCTATPKTGCVTNTYNIADQVTAVDYTDPDTADITAVTYDPAGRRASVTAANGDTSTWGYDLLGRPTSTTANGRATSYGYDGLSGLVTTVTDPTTAVTTRAFDDAGRLTTVNDGAGRTTGFGYDSDSNWTGTTFPGSVNVDSYGVDRAGRMTSATYTQGSTTLASLSFTRDDLGQVTGEDLTDLPGADSTFGYNQLNQLSSVNNDTFGYDQANNLTTHPGTVQGFDTGGRICWTATSGSGDCTTPPVGATTFSYDTRGNRTTQTPDQGPATTYSYNQLNQLTEANAPAPATNAGRFVAVAPARVADTRPATRAGLCPTAPSECVAIPADGTRTVQVTGQAGIPTDVSAVALRVTAQNPAGVGRLSVAATGTTPPPTSDVAYKTGEPSTNTVLTAVDANGQITLNVTGAGTDVTVDVDGYYTTATQTTGGTYTPVAATQLIDTTSSSSQAGCVGTCDTLAPGDDLVAQIAGQAAIPTSGVAAVALNVTTTAPTAPGALTVWGSGNATSPPADPTVVYGPESATTRLVIAQVSGDGRVSIRNDAGSGTTDLTVDVVGWYADNPNPDGSTFHPIDDVSLIDATPNTRACTLCQSSGPLTLSVTDLAEVPDDNVTAVAVEVTAINGGSDDHLTLYETGTTAPSTPTVQFAPSQARSNTAIVPVNPDGDISLATTQTVGVAVAVIGYYTSTAVALATSYTYDTTGLRHTRTTADAQVTTFDWDTNAGLPLLVAETTGTDTTRYIYGPGALPVEQINPDGTIAYLHHDQLGTTRLLTDNLGAETGSATYNPYGTLQASAGTLSALGYAGQYTDQETGLQYLRARYYDPTTAQFLTRDPLATLTGEPYGYTGGNPTNATDPTGLFWGDLTRTIAQVSIVVASVALVSACGATFVCGAVVFGSAAFLSYTVDHTGIGSDQWSWREAITQTAIGAAVGGVANVAAGALGFSTAGATETVAATNGETAATAYGRFMHATYDYGPGFAREFTLDAGGRVDAINFATREVLELKPNNPRAIRLGGKQLEGYLEKLNEQFPGDPWTGKVVTYER